MYDEKGDIEGSSMFGELFMDGLWNKTKLAEELRIHGVLDLKNYIR